jgi:hypothetical protein
MALATPNYFDEFARMRNPSRSFNARKNYSVIIQQLKDACREFGYYDISPQNLVEPAELLPVVAVKFPNHIKTFVDPKVVEAQGKRLRYEACGNIFLMHKGKKIHPIVLVRRPTRLTLSYITPDGNRKTRAFADRLPKSSREQSDIGKLVHELDHLQGRLIVDEARDRCFQLYELLGKRLSEGEPLTVELAISAMSHLPYVLVRDGDRYVLRHGHEFRPEDLPIISPDALYTDGFWEKPADVARTFVPRCGELLPIQTSKFVRSFFKKTSRS